MPHYILCSFIHNPTHDGVDTGIICDAPVVPQRKRKGGFIVRIQRLYTLAGEDAYARIPFVQADLETTDAEGLTTQLVDRIIPASWSHKAVLALLAGLCPRDVPMQFRKVEENTVPSWLWRSVPDHQSGTLGAECSFKNMFDRIAGALTYTGWKAGYFNAEADAHAFYDEWRYMMATQIIALPAAYYAKLGLYWAYGFEGRASEGVWLDPRSGRIRVRALQVAHPQILDIIGQGTPTLLAADDHAVQAAIHHQHTSEATAMALRLGTRLLQTQLDALYQAALNDNNLTATLAAVRQMGVSEKLISATLERAQQRQPALQLPEPPPAVSALVQKTPHQFVLQSEIKNEAWRSSLNALWHYNEPAILLSSVVKEWSSLPFHPAEQGLSQDGTALLPLNTAMSHATLNLLPFLQDNAETSGGFDHAGFAHCTRLASIGMDLLLQLAGYPDEHCARRTLATRPFILGYHNLAPTLLAMGYAYDSAAGRAMAGAMTAFMSGIATTSSGEMAAALGMAEDFSTQRDDILRVLRNQRRAAYGETEGYEAVSLVPVGLQLDDCPDLALLAAVRRVWDQAVEFGHTVGLRNLHRTGLTSDHANGAPLDAVTTGLLPLSHLVQWRQFDDETFALQPLPAVLDGLNCLGYDLDVQHTVGAQLVGYRSLHSAPHVNHDNLRELGFDDAALQRIEAALVDATDIRFAIHPWVVGLDYCAQHFGLSEETLDNPHFDLLAHLGFSETEITAANIYCCGVMDSTPDRLVGIKPQHRHLLACLKEDGTGGLSPEAVIRMAGAVQPFLNGLAVAPVQAANSLSHADMESLLELAAQCGMKSFILHRAPTAPALDTTPCEGANRTLGDAMAQNILGEGNLVQAETINMVRRVVGHGSVRGNTRVVNSGTTQGARLKVRISELEPAIPEQLN